MPPPSPYTREDSLPLLGPAARAPREGGVPMSCVSPQNVPGSDSRHRSGDHQPLLGSIDLDRDVLLLELLWHTLHLSFLQIPLSIHTQDHSLQYTSNHHGCHPTWMGASLLLRVGFAEGGQVLRNLLPVENDP